MGSIDCEPVAVACAADSHYALPLAVTLTSLGIHAGPAVPIEAFVLNDGLSESDKARVASSLPAHVRLHWQEPPCTLAGLPKWGGMSATTYHKLTLGEWLPRELQRAIWLDCDVLVLRDIASLWRPGSSGRGLFAAQDRRVPLVSSRFGVAAWRELGFSPEAPYFNAGVMLLDLAQWRDQEVGRRALDYVRRYRDRVYFWDQEALNAILAGNWRELDPRWNWHPELDHLFQNRSPGQPHAADAPAADPWIVHFSGSLKPWRFAATSRYRALYNDYLDRTAWTGWRPVARPHHRLLHWYATSNLRRRLYPQEQWATMVLRALTWQLQNGGPG